MMKMIKSFICYLNEKLNKYYRYIKYTGDFYVFDNNDSFWRYNPLIIKRLKHGENKWMILYYNEYLNKRDLKLYKLLPPQERGNSFYNDAVYTLDEAFNIINKIHRQNIDIYNY